MYIDINIIRLKYMCTKIPISCLIDVGINKKLKPYHELPAEDYAFHVHHQETGCYPSFIISKTFSNIPTLI